jgi:hypothetical protein
VIRRLTRPAATSGAVYARSAYGSTCPGHTARGWPASLKDSATSSDRRLARLPRGGRRGGACAKERYSAFAIGRLRIQVVPQHVCSILEADTSTMPGGYGELNVGIIACPDWCPTCGDWPTASTLRSLSCLNVRSRGATDRHAARCICPPRSSISMSGRRPVARNGPIAEAASSTKLSSAASECRVLSLRGEIQTTATEVLSGRRHPVQTPEKAA